MKMKSWKNPDSLNFMEFHYVCFLPGTGIIIAVKFERIL